MKNTTLCYIENNGAYLMLHRTKKENDINKDKWLGIGGRFEWGETPYECAKREIKEETGLDATNLKYRGIVTFVSDEYPTEYMHLFTATEFTGTMLTDCNEGDLCWVKKEDVYKLPIWEGDKVFFRLLEEKEDFFSLKLVYQKDTLIDYKIEL